ncbi:MAG: hypothetical protein HFJ05_07430 [Eubacterium sp.]|nr:hypothetical protein [Eubacterium sp.]
MMQRYWPWQFFPNIEFRGEDLTQIAELCQEVTDEFWIIKEQVVYELMKQCLK